jgi:galactoside O-acetyltransferase
LVGPTIPEPYQDKIIYAPVILERFANVGTNVVILPGVTIAEGSVVGVGSVVSKSTKPWGIYVGSPARAVKTRPKEKILKFAKELGY